MRLVHDFLMHVPMIMLLADFWTTRRLYDMKMKQEWWKLGFPPALPLMENGWRKWCKKWWYWGLEGCSALSMNKMPLLAAGRILCGFFPAEMNKISSIKMIIDHCSDGVCSRGVAFGCGWISLGCIHLYLERYPWAINTLKAGCVPFAEWYNQGKSFDLSLISQ